MAIYRLLHNTAFSPEDVSRMGAAYESALVSLNISRTDPRTEQIAKRIIEVAQAGVRESAKISALAIDGLNFG